MSSACLMRGNLWTKVISGRLCPFLKERVIPLENILKICLSKPIRIEQIVFIQKEFFLLGIVEVNRGAASRGWRSDADEQLDINIRCLL